MTGLEVEFASLKRKARVRRELVRPTDGAGNSTTHSYLWLTSTRGMILARYQGISPDKGEGRGA